MNLSMVAVVILLILVILIVLWDSCYGPYSHEHVRKQPKSNYSTTHNHTNPTTEVSNPKGSPSETSQGNPITDQKHRHAEQRYWDRQAGAAERLNRITVIGAIVGLLGLVGIGGTLLVTKQSADASRQQAEAAVAGNRAWIEPAVAIAGELESSNRGLVIKLLLSYKNIGKTPATYVQHWYFIAPHAWNDVQTHKRVVGCSKPPTLVFGFNPSNGGTTIFPDRGNSEIFESMIQPSTIKDALAKTGTDDGIMIEVAGCVNYVIEGDTNHLHSTPFRYNVVHAYQGKRAGFPVAMDVIKVTPQEELVIENQEHNGAGDPSPY